MDDRFVEHPASPLNNTDRDAFLEMTEDDSEPNESLRKAAERFREMYPAKITLVFKGVKEGKPLPLDLDEIDLEIFEI